MATSGVVWWAVAPVLVQSSDTRLAHRNPVHLAKLVRFYRAWGVVAILVGAGVAWALA